MIQRGSGFHYHGGELWCEGIRLRQIAAEFGTPSYVYSQSSVEHHVKDFRLSMADLEHQICFAVKANSNLTILRILKNLGCGFDIVSLGELHRVERIGAPPESILFSGVGKTAQELEAAVRLGLMSINLESVAELRQLSDICTRLASSSRVSLRVNLDIAAQTHPYIATGQAHHKFGLSWAECEEALRLLRRMPRLKLRGLSCHIGSQITQIAPYIEAFERLSQLGERVRASGFPLEFLDLGGGFGISYGSAPPPNLRSLGEALRPTANGWTVVFEPGRSLVGEAGVLLTSTILTKTNGDRHFTVVDAAMNDLLRPALYRTPHRVQAVREKQPEIQTDVVGPICESADVFFHDCRLPALETGDLLAIMDAGAYGFALSSNYNSRGRAAEVLVSGTDTRLVRRRESVEDLVRGE